MKPVISPTPGRIVWFYPDPNQATNGFNPPAAGQPLGAMVAAVHSDTMVNLMVVDAAGVAHSRTSVQLLQDGDMIPDRAYCTWMPFQKGQAAAQAQVSAVTSVAGTLSTHSTDVLYPRIHAAMKELETLHPQFSETVNRAYNHLHRAFWSEAPCPAKEPQLRIESPQPETGPGSTETRLTFDELVQYGRDHGANIVDGMPWSFQVDTVPVTHETDKCYLVGAFSRRVEPDDVLVIERSVDERGTSRTIKIEKKDHAPGSLNTTAPLRETQPFRTSPASLDLNSEKPLSSACDLKTEGPCEGCQ